MAGNGQRFFDAGYDLPKPLIDVKGAPMFKRVLDNITDEYKGVEVVAIVRPDHVEKYSIDQKLKEALPNIEIVVTDGPTEGAACTVMLAIDQYSEDDVLIANCDQIAEFNASLFHTFSTTSDGTILTFFSDNPEPKHSYVTVDSQGFLKELAEKRKISDVATVGVYHFSSQREFSNAVKAMMEADDRINGEFYLAPVYNYYRGNVSCFDCTQMYGMGTPEELEAFKQTDYYEAL